MAELGPVVILAGGEGSRIRSMMDGEGYPSDYPKHLLPTGGPNGETLLGRIVRQASAEPINQPPIVYATQTGRVHMQIHPDIGRAIYEPEQFRFSMDPIYYRLRETGSRVIGCAGDFYSDFNWSDFLDEHDRSGLPMSVLAGCAYSSEKSAVFKIESGVITGFSRPEVSRPDDIKNIGAYIIDPDPAVVSVMEELLPEDPNIAPSDDTIFIRMVELGLVGAITNVGTQHFNINSQLEYETMLACLSESFAVEAS